ncbi:MAG: ArsA family ATPase [Acidobacteriia bacterium]|nr:ArsA family ATPase [Terriglobia bacterium]
MNEATPSFLDYRGFQLLIFGGKGGVGKTTCATAAALRLAQGAPALSFLLVSTDPAHSLADSLAGLRPPGNLKVLELDAREYLAAFKRAHNDQLREIASRGTFLDDEEIRRFLDLSLPGLDELMAFLEISRWVENRSYDCIILDTAPGGHTLRLLAMPAFLRKWLNMLDALLAKHRYMKWAFARSAHRDELDSFLEELGASVERMEELLCDPARCRFVPVMLAEAMSIRETVAIVKEVERLQLPIDEIVINRLYPDNSCALCRDERLRQLRELRNVLRRTCLSRYALWAVPLYAEEVRGQKALESFWASAARITQAPREERGLPALPALGVEAAARWPPPAATLLIFAGKGGVGKTTLACATALQLAENAVEKDVLLFSTGPAHSLSGCLGLSIDSRPRAVASGLAAMQIDSEAEFAALKQHYAGDIARFLESLSSQFDLTFDREVLERILDVSPPGLDEVMGLTRVMTLLASGRYEVLVLDSAATGHLIRLLELPEIIDQWLKLFFDLFLRYQQIFRLTRFSQELVTMSKNLKSLRALLTNPAKTALYAVSIPTDMALEETQDLVAACERLGIRVPGLFLNLVTPLRDCELCSALHRRESLVRKKFQQSFSDRDLTVVYRRGEMRGLCRLGELGRALFERAPAESSAYVA